MGVTDYNYRIRNVVYHTQMYFGIKEEGANYFGDTEPVIYYPGYNNGISPQGLIPLSEWEALSSDAQTESKDPNEIEGDFSGFTNQATVWHTPLHIFASDGDTYAIGFAIIYRIPQQYTLNIYTYNKTDGYWHGSSIMDFNHTNPLIPISTLYDELPEYIYLMMERNSSAGAGEYVYPYPERGGYYFYRQRDQKYIYSYHWWFNHAGAALDLIKVLYDNGQETDVNPDPSPTPIANDDPYAPGGSAWTGGGDGSFDITGDDVGIPNLPDISATSTGFITLFNPSISQLNNLCNYMWSDLFDLDTFKKIFADPMQCILGLSIVPLDVPSGGSAHVKVGNIDTGVSMTKAAKQYVEVDCGSVSIEEYSGSYLDYDPYTEIQIYLPYVGIHPLKTDDVMNKTVTVKYHVDILSGACVAYVKCGASVLYSFVGQCSSSIPITGNDWTNVINGALSIAASIGSMVATGGATAPTQIANIASTAVNSMKPQVEKSGSMSGTGGLMAIQTPYLIITRPNLAIPEGQNRYTGYPSYINVPLGSIKGYTEVEKVHLDNIPCTESELNEIEKLLKGGVIL